MIPPDPVEIVPWGDDEPTISLEDHNRVFQALTQEHRYYTAQLVALCAIYRGLLDEAGIEAPQDKDGPEALRRYRKAFIAAGYADPEQHSELMNNWWGEGQKLPPKEDL